MNVILIMINKIKIYQQENVNKKLTPLNNNIYKINKVFKIFKIKILN